MKIHIDKQETVLLSLCFFVYLLMAILAPGFFTHNNSLNLLNMFIPLLIVCVGQTYVILTAGIDLSVTSIIGLTSVIGGFLMSSDSGLFNNPSLNICFGILVMILSGALLGLFNGISISKFKMPPFMVTLTTMIFFSGAAIWMTKSQNIYHLPEQFVDLPYTHIVGVSIPTMIGIGVVLLAGYILHQTQTGEWIYALGHNEKTARISGVQISYTLIFVYVFSGSCAAIASILYTARLETGSPVMAQNLLLDVIGAVVIGGTSLFGGRGKVSWTILGVMLIALIDNGLNLLGLSFFVIMMIKGVVILLSVLLYSYLIKSQNTN